MTIMEILEARAQIVAACRESLVSKRCDITLSKIDFIQHSPLA